MKALTVRQPWAWLIAAGHKDIENRTCRTSYRGPLLIHAGVTPCPYPLRDLIREKFGITIPTQIDYGGIVGVADVIDCVQRHDSRWFEGPVGWVLENARALPIIRCRGYQHLFDPSAEVMRILRDRE